ncbi:uncharacterized protein KY384_003980 [Bacidia gigantensis]|uniref:uncharacterized protein n=1 Tax=Bacidia gigantensis TaxID=2732470 RepID=UPI001D05A5CA|nr:uncharacterized protein KY384_003980 [Bacidia gigantensis]KAG8532339.1 hypothetical protein KY384_003980 [Bacidia gigantensis]
MNPRQVNSPKVPNLLGAVNNQRYRGATDPQSTNLGGNQQIRPAPYQPVLNQQSSQLTGMNPPKAYAQALAQPTPPGLTPIRRDTKLQVDNFEDRRFVFFEVIRSKYTWAALNNP